MAGWTNRGKKLALEIMCRGEFDGAAIPTHWYVALVTDTPTDDTNLMSDLTEITAGNGYTSGGGTEGQLTIGTTDWDAPTENDTTNIGSIKAVDVVWTASGGPIPASGGDALYAVLTDDDGTVANRNVMAYWSLGGGRSVSDGQTLTLQDCELQLTET